MNFLRFTCLILCLFLMRGVSAQVFFKTYDPQGSAIQDMVQAADGGYFLAGNNAFDSTLFLSRVNSSGEPVWTNHLNLQHAKTIASEAAADGGWVVLAEFYADTNGYKNAVLKISASGNPVWTRLIENPYLPNSMRDLAATTDGGFILAGDDRDSTLALYNRLIKLDGDGNIVWDKRYGTGFLHTIKIAALGNGDFAIAGGRNGGDLSLARVNATGDLLWQQSYVKTGYQRAYELLAGADGGFSILSTDQNPGGNKLNVALLKTDALGQESWFQSYDVNLLAPALGGIAQDNDGFYYVSFAEASSANFINVMQVTPFGDKVWLQELSSLGYPYKALLTADNYIAMAGGGETRAFLLKMDLSGNYLTNTISGRVYDDDDFDCAFNPGENGLSNFIVAARDATNTRFFKRVEADGTFELKVSEGTFSLTTTPFIGEPGFYAPCDTPTVTITGSGQTTSGHLLGVQTVAECPLLEVSIGEGILRRCLQTAYFVTVRNYGNLQADDVSVELTADTVLNYVSSTVPLSAQNGQLYSFDLPALAPGAVAEFQVNFQVKCSAHAGDVVCVQARALPDTSCIPPNGFWDGSAVEVSGNCDNGAIRFHITNTRNAPMTQSLDYVIIEDHIMFRQGAIQLAANEDTVIVIENPAGACYLGKVNDPGHHASLIDLPAAAVENCLVQGNLNLALEFETEPNNRAIANTCSQIVGSFDPNDKQAFPQGWKEQHIIERNQDIEYLIRFQNTGNDTAFLVVIRDTLDTHTLDPGSLRLVAASHPCTWDVTGTGVASFRFDNILLPDSTTNEPASHGFVRFRIRQQPDLPDNTAIRNDAAIFFDFNAPVITNEYFHTIGNPFSVGVFTPTAPELADVAVSPNPLSSEAVFELKGFTPTGPVRFTLLDPLGKVWRTETFYGQTYRFKNRDLAPGMYFYRLDEAGRLLGSGRVAIH